MKFAKDGEAYCYGCGRPRPIVGRSVDERYPLVQCGSRRREGTLDRTAALAVIKDRRKRLKARRDALSTAYPVDRVGPADLAKMRAPVR